MDTTIKTVRMSNADLREVATLIMQAMNDAQFKSGRTIDEVLMATAFALGAGIAQRGGVLLLDTPLRRALPPLVSGYESKLKDRATNNGDTSHG